MLLDFSRGAQRVPPVCCALLLGSDGQGVSKYQSPHGRDGHDPFFCAAKSNFKVTMILAKSIEKMEKEARTVISTVPALPELEKPTEGSEVSLLRSAARLKTLPTP